MKRKILYCAVIFTVILLSSCSKAEYDYFASLYGVVTDNATGEPLGDANVVLSPGGETKITGSDGHFEFSGIDPQQYTITVQKAGYNTNRKTVTAIVNESTAANVSLVKNE